MSATSTPKDSVTKNGVTKNGVTKNGVTKNGVTKNGVTKNGVTKNGVTNDDVTPKVNVSTDTTNGSRVVWWQRGLYAYAGVLTFGVLIANLAYWLQGGFSAVLLVILWMILGMTRLVLSSIKGGFEEPDGLKVTSTEPELVAFVNQVAAEVNAPAPDDVYLVVDALVTVTEASRYFGLRSDKSVAVIGMPFLHTMSQRELAAALGHQLAHVCDSDVEHGARAFRGLSFAGRLIAIERKAIVNGIFGSYARKMFRGVGGVGVAQEKAAEQAAVNAYGSDAMLSALAKLDDVESAWNQMLRDYVVPALQNHVHPEEMFAGFAELMESEVRAEQRASDVERRRGLERSEFELHRAPAERAELVRSWPHHEATSAIADTPASDLLEGEGVSGVVLTAQWAHKLMTAHTEPQPWSELAADIFSAKTYKTADLPFEDDDMTGAERFEAALDIAENNEWGEVNQALTRRLKAITDEHDRKVEWARCVVIEAAAEKPGFSWKHCWDGAPKLRRDAGGPFDAKPIAELIAAGKPAEAQVAFEMALAGDTANA